jgi:hypothetical protein
MRTLSILLLIAACSANKAGPTGAGPASSDSVAKLDPKTRSKLAQLVAADNTLLPVQVAGASCSAGDRAACTCGVTMVGIQSCSSGGKFGRCACGQDGGVAALEDGGGAGMGGGAAGMGGAAGAGGGADGGVADASATADAGPQPRFVVNGDGTVSDTTTGLEWQQTNNATAGTHDQALAYCTALSLNGSKWRLPTQPELSGITDLNFNPVLDPSVFKLVPASVCNSTGTRCNFWTLANEALWMPSGTCGTSFTTVNMLRQMEAGVNGGQPFAQVNCYSNSNSFLYRCVR